MINTETAKYSGKEGAYVCVVPDAKSVATINKVFLSRLKGCGFDEYLIPPNDLHATVIYSKDKAPDPRLLPYLQPETRIQAYIKAIDVWPGHDEAGYIVLSLHSPALVALNRLWTKLGCEDSHPDYKPHISLAEGFLSESDELSDDVTTYIAAYNAVLKQTPLRVTLFGHHVENINTD